MTVSVASVSVPGDEIATCGPRRAIAVAGRAGTLPCTTIKRLGSPTRERSTGEVLSAWAIDSTSDVGEGGVPRTAATPRRPRTGPRAAPASGRSDTWCVRPSA
jgi:hypothetical protein